MRELFDQLQALYDELEQHKRSLPPPRGECGSCGRCCEGPPLYMTCSDLEFEYAMDYARSQGTAPLVHFKPCGEGDRRLDFSSWTCPFYSKSRGCTVYPRRPLACRVFGPWTQERIWWDFCVYQGTSRIYQQPPLWEKYTSLLSRYPSRRGYVFPDQLLCQRPAVELLMDMSLPWAPLHQQRLVF